jgi:hypothetical protein
MLEWYEGDKIGNILSTHIIPRLYIIRVIQNAYGDLLEMEVINIENEHTRPS